jgi:hypothetical protein
MAMLNRARAEEIAADGLIANLEQITEDEDERLLGLAKHRVERATASGRLHLAPTESAIGG